MEQGEIYWDRFIRYRLLARIAILVLLRDGIGFGSSSVADLDVGIVGHGVSNHIDCIYSRSFFCES